MIAAKIVINIKRCITSRTPVGGDLGIVAIDTSLYRRLVGIRRCLYEFLPASLANFVGLAF
jgi:hypothetical protein